MSPTLMVEIERSKLKGEKFGVNQEENPLFGMENSPVRLARQFHVFKKAWQEPGLDRWYFALNQNLSLGRLIPFATVYECANPTLLVFHVHRLDLKSCSIEVFDVESECTAN